MKYKREIVTGVVCGWLLILEGCVWLDTEPVETFTDPLLPSGADPWALWHDGHYYYMHTLSNRLDLWKTNDLTNLQEAKCKTIWIPTDPANAKHLWAPEIHVIDGKWYVYYAVDDGNTDNHQLYVLENSAQDPFDGAFEMKGRFSTDPDDNWAIDGSLFQHKGDWYLIWCGWQTMRIDTETQCIYVARMENPWTLASERVLISKPEFDWERIWQRPDGKHPRYIIYVNEGPQMLKRGNKMHIIYSASGCWTPNYCLGMLSASADSDLLNPASWTKSQTPVFQQSPENGVFGPGHNSFFKSPDGTEDWILYHANDNPNDGCGNKRKPRAQKIGWTDDDMPIFGVPISTDSLLVKPSGTK